MIRVRTLREDEPMPTGFDTGFEKMPVMKDFCWVAENEGGDILAILMGAPCHGAMFLVRLRVDAAAPKFVATLLFRQFIRDSMERGFKGYFTFINPMIDTERRLISICRRANGAQWPQVHVPLVGKFEEAVRY